MAHLAVSVGCTGRITRFPFLPWPVAPTQSPCSLGGVACGPMDQPSPKLSSFRIRNAPAQVSPADVDVDSEAKPAWATRNTQACPVVPAGATAPTGAESPAGEQGFPSPGRPEDGRRAAGGAGEEAEERGCAESAGWRRRLLGRWSPRPPRPPSLLSIQRGGGQGDPGSHASMHSTSSHFLTHHHPHRSLPTPREGTAPSFTDEKLAHCPR